MRVLALIPARGGSKRLPGKNLRRLGGKPLIVWSIDAARGLPEVCDILISTDAPDIAEVAREAGALVPWLRPASLATDEASSIDVCLHATDWYEQSHGPVDAVLLLQPTSPFRKPETLRRGIDLFRSGVRRSVVGVAPAGSHPLWCFKIEAGRLRPFIDGGGSGLRSQDLPPAFAISGAFYMLTPDQIRTRRSFIDADTQPLLIDDPAEGIDIDTDWDWRLAEAVLGDPEPAP